MPRTPMLSPCMTRLLLAAALLSASAVEASTGV